MPPVATAASRVLPGRERRSLPRRGAIGRRESGVATLDERITGLWSRLVAEGRADCPVCGAELLAGRPCAGCGAEIA